MKNFVFLLGTLLLILAVVIDIVIIASGMTILGVFSLLGSILFFIIGTIWFIYRDDQTFHFSQPLLVIPAGLFGGAVFSFFKKSQIFYKFSLEDLPGVGNLIMARYQIGLWLVSVMILFAFVIGGSMMVRRSE